MSKLLRAKNLRVAMLAMYPDVQWEGEDNNVPEHPMIAVGIVLLSAALLQTIQAQRIMAFTGYSQQFISAIALNMMNNKLWSNGEYDHSSWMLQDGLINDDELRAHVEIACGMLWEDEADAHISADPCDVYWEERGGFIR